MHRCPVWLEDLILIRICTCTRDPRQHRYCLLAKQRLAGVSEEPLPSVDSLQWQQRHVLCRRWSVSSFFWTFALNSLKLCTHFGNFFYFQKMPQRPTQAVLHMSRIAKTEWRRAAIRWCFATAIATVASAGDFLHMFSKALHHLWKCSPPLSQRSSLRQEA